MELRSSPTRIPGFDQDPLTAKKLKRVLSNTKKLEEFYPHIFTAKINTHIAGGDVLSREFYYKLKEIIFNQQAQSAWMPEEKVNFVDSYSVLFMFLRSWVAVVTYFAVFISIMCGICMLQKNTNIFLCELQLHSKPWCW